MRLVIQPLSEDQVESAKSVITEVCLEFFGRPPLDFDDMHNISAHYAPPSGKFLVLMDGGQLVGTGAIRRIDNEVCELKRMWFLPAYRRRGYGAAMSERLLSFARSSGYKCVRLDTSPILERACKLYRRLGFQVVDRYNDGPCDIFMELRL